MGRSIENDEHNVLRLAHKYAYALDYSRPDILERIFTEDSEWTFSNVPGIRKYDEILKIPERLHASFENTHHAIQSQHVELDGDAASGVTYCMAYHFFSRFFVDEGRDPISIAHNYLIRYDDRFRLDGEKWKFSFRKLNVLYRRVDSVAEIPALDRLVDWNA